MVWIARCYKQRLKFIFGLLRFRALRKQTVKNLTLKKKRRYRHEKFNLKDLIRKSEEQYVDFQSASRLILTDMIYDAMMLQYYEFMKYVILSC